jgi:hypothetical protein
MRPINFRQQNCTFAANQPQYAVLPAFKEQGGRVVSCWKATLFERVYFLFTGKLWLSQLTFETPLQPQRPAVLCPITPYVPPR